MFSLTHRSKHTCKSRYYYVLLNQCTDVNFIGVILCLFALCSMKWVQIQLITLIIPIKSSVLHVHSDILLLFNDLKFYWKIYLIGFPLQRLHAPSLRKIKLIRPFANDA